MTEIGQLFERIGARTYNSITATVRFPWRWVSLPRCTTLKQLYSRGGMEGNLGSPKEGPVYGTFTGAGGLVCPIPTPRKGNPRACGIIGGQGVFWESQASIRPSIRVSGGRSGGQRRMATALRGWRRSSAKSHLNKWLLPSPTLMSVFTSLLLGHSACRRLPKSHGRASENAQPFPKNSGAARHRQELTALSEACLQQRVRLGRLLLSFITAI